MKRIRAIPPSVFRLPPSPRGMVLVIVLVAVALLSLAAYTFTELMYSENVAARLVARDAQARALTESAAEMVRLYLAQTPQSLLESGGTFSNSARFQAVQVTPFPDDGVPRNRGRFTIISPLVDQGEVTGVRFGLENESSRLNLNTLLFLEQQASGMNALNSLSGSLASGGGSTTSSNGQQSTTGGSNASNTGGGSTGSTGGTAGETAGSARDLLMALPGMTEEIADAILDWIDEDDETREFGAEMDYYSSLGYGPKNGPLDTIEELLLVRGVTPDLLFGADSNRNGIIDPSEQQRAYLSQATNSEPEVDRGWAPYLTLYSKESNMQADGTPRIDLNNPDLAALHEQLSTALNADWANFIILCLQYGPYTPPPPSENNGNNQDASTHRNNPFRLVVLQRPPRGDDKPPSENPGGGAPKSGGPGGGSSGNSNNNADEDLEEISAGSVAMDFTKPVKSQIKQILDLVGVGVKMPDPAQASSGTGTSTGSGQQGQQKQVIVKGPFPDDPSAAQTYLPLLMDHVTVNPATSIPGRINLNQASRVVLQGIPGIEPQTLDAILANREPELTAEKPDRIHETWLYSEGFVDLATMKKMMPFVTGSGAVYRAQIIGYFDEMGPSHRVDVVIDASNATNGVPRIVFWRDMSNLGRGFGLDTLGAGPAE